MKWLGPQPGVFGLESLPVRGAWIEIGPGTFCITTGASLPVRGAWIEIDGMLAAMDDLNGSLPVRGAWIEMETDKKVSELIQCRSP